MTAANKGHKTLFKFIHLLVECNLKWTFIPHECTRMFIWILNSLKESAVLLIIT